MPVSASPSRTAQPGHVLPAGLCNPLMMTHTLALQAKRSGERVCVHREGVHGPAGRTWPGRAVEAVRGLAETGILQLLVDIGGELVEAFIDRQFLGHHLLECLRPLGGEVEEQRLRREVDLRPWR